MGHSGSQQSLSLSTWLDILSVTQPPRGVLVVGAGSGESQWIKWLAVRPEAKVWLIEGDEGQFQDLKHQVPPAHNWMLRRDVVADTTDSVTFHQASNPAESGLIPPNDLRALWPNLRPIHAESYGSAVTLDALWDEAEQGFNWLLLDCLPAATLLKGGSRLLAQADLVVVRGAVSDDVDIASEARHAAADALLCSAGLKCVRQFPQRHPALAHVLYIRDIGVREQALAAAKAEAEIAQSELLRRTELEIEQIRSEHEAALAERDRAVNAGEATIVSVEANLRRDLHALGSALSAHDRENRALAGAAAKADTNSVLRELHHVRNAIETLRADHIVELAERDRENRTHAGTSVATDASSVLRELQQMRSEIENLQADHMLQLENVEARLRKGLRDELSKAVKQIEAFTFIQNYMAGGKGLPSFHGWPISPDIGQFLIERIGERRYDMTIEFGSGTSTALQARALEINRNLRANQNPTSSRPSSHATPYLCSFEHNPRFLRKTQKLLRSLGVEEHVELLHTPLNDWEDETGKYSYYDCNAALVALAKRLSSGGTKRILVLVDGPPGSTCLNARYPAVPLIFKHLDKHEIDLVLDDADRPDEKATIALWRAHWKKRGISVREEMIASEKGLYFATNTDDSA